MKQWRKVLIAGMAASMALILGACGGGSGNSSTGANKVTVSMYMPGDQTKNYKEVITAANKQLQKKYPNIQLDMKFIGWGDYGQKYSVIHCPGLLE